MNSTLHYLNLTCAGICGTYFTHLILTLDGWPKVLSGGVYICACGATYVARSINKNPARPSSFKQLCAIWSAVGCLQFGLTLLRGWPLSLALCSTFVVGAAGVIYADLKQTGG